MEPVLLLPADMPPHDEAPLVPVPSRCVASWPAGTFVENLVVFSDGSIAVSVLSEAQIDVINQRGDHRILTQLPAPPTGLVVLEGLLLAAAGPLGQGPIQILSIDPQTGNTEQLLTVDGAVFLNGLTRLAGRTLISPDSHQGRIYLIDLDTRTTRVWLEDERLTPSPRADFLPGGNGIKRFGEYVYVSSNSRALLLRFPATGGAIETIAERLRADDFAFDVGGNLFLATHIGGTLDRRSPDGERVAIAGIEQGMAGSTACAFGRTPRDRTKLYVTTTGGIFGPPGGQVQPAKLIRLDVDVEGAPL